MAKLKMDAPELEQLTRLCVKNSTIPQNLFDDLEVYRGLRDSYGKGVRSGLTKISSVDAFKEEDGKVYGDNTVTGETHLEVDGKALCSMNMWGFTPDYFSLSEVIFEKFLEENINELKKEYYIPYAVDNMIKENGYKCEVLSTDSRWFGVTYKEDRPGVVAKFQELADKGVYPTPLWKK